jgi:FtsZ-binding cell division protein ZapB
MEKTPKRHQLSIKFRKDQLQILKDFITLSQKFPSHAEYLDHLISLTKSSKIVQFQQCEHFNEIPQHPDYIECEKPLDGKKTITSTLKREYCYFGCPSSHMVKIELNLALKIQAQTLEASRLEKEKKGFIDEIKELEPKLDEKRKEDHELTEGIKNLQKIRDSLRDENENLTKKHDAKAKKIKDLEEQETQFSKIEPQIKSEPPERTISEPQPQVIKETFEKTEKITKEILIKGVDEGKILCPKSGQQVNMKEQCNMPNCPTFLNCKPYVDRINALYGRYHETQEQKT